MSNAKIYDDKETVFVMIPFIDPSHMVDFTHLARAMIGMGIKSENIIILSADNKSHQKLPNVIPMKPYSPTLQKQDISITESVQSFTSDVPILSKLKVAFNYSIHNYPTFISALDEVFQNHETLFQFMQERNVQNRTKNLHLVIDIVFAAAYEWAHARQLNFTVFSNVPQIFAFEDFGNLIPRMLYETTSLERALRILKRQGLMAFIWNRLNEKVFKFVEFLTMAIPMVQKLDQYRVTSGMKALGVPFMDLSRYFVISLTLPGYAYTNVPLPPNVKLVGFTTSVKSNVKQTHSEDLTEWLEQHKKTNRKIVYMAFGTKASLSLEHARNVIQNILEFRNQSFDMVVSLKFSLQELFPNPNATYDSNRLIVRKWVNQEQVLKYASLFISHGGAHSLFEAIEESVPLILIPQFADQFLNTIYAEDAKIAKSIYDPMDRDELLEAVNDLIENHEFYKSQLRKWHLKNVHFTQPYAGLLQDENAKRQVSPNMAMAAHWIQYSAKFGPEDIIHAEKLLSPLEKFDVVKTCSRSNFQLFCQLKI